MNTALKIRNILFKSFIISYGLLVLTTVLYMMGMYDWLLKLLFGWPDQETEQLLITALTGAKLFAIFCFLIPALAIHWEYRPKKR